MNSSHGQAPIRTAVVHVGGIGDFILACPAIARLNEQGPLELVGRPERLALAVLGGIAQQAHSLDAIDFDSVFSRPSAILCDFFSRFERVVVWMKDEDGSIDRGLRACQVSERIIRPGLPPAYYGRHASCYYLEQLGLPPTPPFRLELSPSLSRWDLLIHPGSGGSTKNWSHERFRDIAQRAVSSGARVAWIRGPAEEDLAAPASLPELRPSSLVDLARILASGHVYLGNDSGVTHLAATVGVRTLAVFGPTDPNIWAPLGKHVTILKGRPWPSTDEVWTAINSCEAHRYGV